MVRPHDEDNKQPFMNNIDVKKAAFSKCSLFYHTSITDEAECLAI